MRNKIKFFLFISMMLSLAVSAFSQAENRDLRAGNRHYRHRNYNSAEKSYRAAISKNPRTFYGNYNLGNALYRKEDWLTARGYYQKAVNLTQNKREKADALHNLGCTYLQEQKYKESVDALRKSMIENPDSEPTRRLLAYAQRMLKKQQDEQKDRPNAGDKKQHQDMSQENARQILLNIDEDEQNMKPTGKDKSLIKNW